MPSASAATASSIDWTSASFAVRTFESGEGVQCPKERKPSVFIALSYGRRSRRSENNEAVALRDGGETRGVGRRSVVVRRQNARLRRLTDLPHESLELHGCEA